MADTDQQEHTRRGIFQERLLAWFRKNRRSFLWRESSDPWLILISELLLKRTLADRVNAFLPSFLEKYRDAGVLAVTDQEELECDLAALGLQKQRAAHLRALGKTLVEEFEGQVPKSSEELSRLPGLGDYGRNALLCFAFGKRVPIIDGNVVRVLLRVFPTRYSRSEARWSPEVWELAWGLLPETADETRNYNLALLDLGALICLPRYPKCKKCPLLAICPTGTKQTAIDIRGA